MKFSPTKQNANQLSKSDSSVLLLGVINISSDFQNNNSTDQSNDRQEKEIKYNESNQQKQQQQTNNYDDQKNKNHQLKYDKANSNYVNYNEEDQMVIRERVLMN